MCTVKIFWRHDYISKVAIEKHNLVAATYMELWLKENTEKIHHGQITRWAGNY